MMSGTGSKGRGESAFTLVEIVVAIAVMGILTALAVPAIDSVQRERIAREPVNQLYLLAREVRLRAMKEKRPYQIVFDREGFRASRFFHPYGGAEEFEQLRLEVQQLEVQQEMIEASAARGMAPEEIEQDQSLLEVREGLQFLTEVEIDPSIRCSLMVWNEQDWISLTGGEFRRWVFQPSGMCEPLSVRMENDGAFFEVTFHPLTADIQRERSWIE